MLSLTRLLQRLARPLGAWLAFTGLAGLAGGACPCCGQAACPAGLAGAGLAGLLLTACLRLRHRLSPPPGPDPNALASTPTEK